jgi:tetrapyrrole methylase family protein/MazG family protein
MTQITIVGLGPGTPEQLTREAWAVLTQAREIWLRTVRHPVVPYLPEGLVMHSFDSLYEEADTFEAVYDAIVKRVLQLGSREQGVVYAVPGHPLVGESTVSRILQAVCQANVKVRIVSGLSFVEPTLTALSLDALNGLQIMDALDVVTSHYPALNPDLPVLLAQVYSRSVASEVKLALMNLYSDEHLTALVDAAGTPAESIVWGPLYEIDHREVTPLTSLYIVPCSATNSFEGFLETMARLRAPDGCPWDREQTHESLRSSLLEETYEVLAAIDAGDVDALREELGDLLLQVVFHAQIATEEDEFRVSDIIAGIDAKLKHRHPHVWGDVQVNGARDVTVNWEIIKRQEREKNGETQRSLLDGIPKTLPALAQCDAYLSRAARIGLDWSTTTEVVKSVERVVESLLQSQTTEDKAGTLGDVLLAIGVRARQLHINPEDALREANARFAQRLGYVERVARQQGVAVEAMPSAEKYRLWGELPAK